MFAIAISLLIVVLVVVLIFYVLSQFTVPEPLGKIIRVAVVVIACLFVIMLLSNLANVAGLDTNLRIR